MNKQNNYFSILFFTLIFLGSFTTSLFGQQGNVVSLYTDDAGDASNFFNTYAGVTFDLENTGNKPIKITSLKIPVAYRDSPNADLDLDIYYTKNSTTNDGVQTDEDEWFLLESKTGIAINEATDWDTTQFTQINLDQPFTLVPNESRGIYLHVSNYPDLEYHYTDGSFTASDNNLTIHSNGYGSAKNAFDNSSSDRAFVGVVHYYVEEGLFTENAGDPSNFDNSYAGVTFDVKNEGTDDLKITGFRVPVGDSSISDLSIYYTKTSSTNVGVSQTPSEWELLYSDNSIQSHQVDAWDETTFTQVDLDAPLVLSPGSSKGIYVYLNNYSSSNPKHDYYYTNGNFVETDGNLTINSNGRASENTLFDNSFEDRAFVGSIQYYTTPASGIEENKMGSIKLYPNPTNETFTIESNSNKLKNIQIYNGLGEKVKSKNIQNKITHLNVSDLETGIYFVKLRLNNGEIVQEKLNVVR